MPSDPRAGPVSCWKSTLRRRPLGPEFPISPAPLAYVISTCWPAADPSANGCGFSADW